MRIVIAGAGKLGRLLAGVLSTDHDVVLIDTVSEKLEQIKGRRDISVIKGSCCDIDVLKRAEVTGADAFIATTGDEATNILACQLASRLNPQKTICRMYGHNCFSEKDKIQASSFGLDNVFSPSDEVADKLISIVKRSVIQDEVNHEKYGAKMEVIVIPRNSPLQNVCIKDIPDRKLMNNIRIAAIIKNKCLTTKVRGDIMLNPGDKLYVCGKYEDVEAFADYISPENEKPIRRILLAGSNEFCVTFARKACSEKKEKYIVSVICKDENEAETMQDKLGDLAPHVLFYKGSSTDEYLLEEAGAQNTDVFINMEEDDESNILSCILVKGMGARKVISITHRPEYSRIFREISMIDCSFCVTTISAQTIIKFLGLNLLHMDDILNDAKATVAKFTVTAKSQLCNKTIMEAKLKDNITFALIFRNQEIITPIGSTQLLENDRILVIGTAELFRDVEKLF